MTEQRLSSSSSSSAAAAVKTVATDYRQSPLIFAHLHHQRHHLVLLQRLRDPSARHCCSPGMPRQGASRDIMSASFRSVDHVLNHDVSHAYHSPGPSGGRRILFCSIRSQQAVNSVDISASLCKIYHQFTVPLPAGDERTLATGHDSKRFACTEKLNCIANLIFFTGT